MVKIKKFEEFVKHTLKGVIEKTDFSSLYHKRKFSRDDSPVRYDSKKQARDESSDAPKKTKRQGRKKDPNAPKKKKGLYFVWANDKAVREEAKASLGGSANRDEINKYLSNIWQNKKGDDDFFKKWNAIVAEDAIRYEAEIKQFKETGSYTPYVPAVEKPAKPAKTAAPVKPAAPKARPVVKPVIDTSDSDSSE